MADSQRIEDLRRRVQKDPASIAFAQLAEECRRAGNFQESIDVCRAGLALHPGYLSARVTLGRALIEIDDLDTARTELEFVLKSAPENLAAIRGLAEIHHRQGRLTEALAQYRAALLLARNDPDLQRTVDELTYQLEPPAPPEPEQGLSFEQAQDELLQNLSPMAPEGLAVEEAVPAAEEPLVPRQAQDEREHAIADEPLVLRETQAEREPIAPPAQDEREPEPAPDRAAFAASVFADLMRPSVPAEPIPVEPETVAEPQAEPEPEAVPEAVAQSEPLPEPQVEPEPLVETTPEPQPEEVSWAAPALEVIPPMLAEHVELEAPQEETAERDHARRTIAALEQWIDAIHVTRAQPLA